jgi:hypothetical protein
MKSNTGEEERKALLTEIRRTISADIFEALYCPSADSEELRHIVDVLASTGKCASALLRKIDAIL